MQITQNDQTAQTNIPSQENTRWVVRELSNMQNCQSPVSITESVTIISARDASASENTTQWSNKTIRVCGDAPTPLYTNSHITYQQSSSSFHLEKYLFTENDIYFSEQIFISLNINLKLKSALRTKYLFYRTLH